MRISIFTLVACLVISPLQMAAQSLEKFVHTMDSLSMVPPQIQSEFDAKYLTENLDYGMTIGIEQTPGGRIWNCFVGGGDNEDAFFVLQYKE